MSLSDSAAENRTEVADKTSNEFIRQEMLLGFIHQLEKESVKYCLLGITNDYPEKINGDIDIVVADQDIKKVLDLLGHLESESDRGIQPELIQVFQHEPTAYYAIVVSKNPNTNNPVYLFIDLCSHFYQLGHRSLKDTDLLTNVRQNEKGLQVCTGPGEFIYYFLKCVEKGEISFEKWNARFEHLTREFNQSPEAAQVYLKKFWSKEDSHQIVKMLQNNEKEHLKEKVSTLKKSLEERRPFSLNHRILYKENQLRRLFQPTGYWVAFIGNDESEKERLVESLQELLSPAFRRSLKDSFSITENDPPASKLLSFFIKALKQFACQILPAKIRSSLVLSNHHFIELWLNPEDLNHQSSQGLPKLLINLAPQPDLFIVLSPPLENILPTISNQPKYFILNPKANQTRVERVQVIQETILSNLKKRTARRFLK